MDRRRFLLVGAAALGLSGCTFGDPDRVDPTAPGPATPTYEDAGVRASVVASEVALIASYRSAIEAAPELAGRLEPLLSHHVAHVARLAPDAATADPDRSPSATATGSPSASSGIRGPDGSSTRPGDAPATPADPAVPTARAMVAALAAAESQAVTQRTGACDSALGAGLARDLCLIAASEAQHAEVLTRLARTLDS